MATKNDISTDIFRHIVESGKENVHVNNDSFWQSLINGDKRQLPKRCARLFGLIFVAIVVVYLILYTAVFYVQNVLLDRTDLQINQFGAFIRKSYNSEYAMFLFDTSEPWAASGIQIQKNDRVFISASGAFHTYVSKLIDAARYNQWADLREQNAVINDNTQLSKTYDTTYRYVYTSMPPLKYHPKKFSVLDTLHRKVRTPRNIKDSALFGDVLFQVVPEYKMRDTEYLKEEQVYAIPRMSGDYKHAIHVYQDGVLSFCVNDKDPYKNIGQVLVVMEIYRKQTRQNAAWEILKGHLLDYPYFWYDYWKHKGCPWLWSSLWNILLVILFLLFVSIEYALLSLLAFEFPFLWLKETWIKLYAMCRDKIKRLCQNCCER